MRVTQSMLNRQMLQNLRANNERMDKYQDMLSTGKRLNKPSDDPVGVSFAMRYKAQLGRNDQYLRNLDAARSFTETTDSAVSKVNDVLQRIRELAVQGANSTVPKDAKEDIAKEIDQLYDELTKLGNTRFNDKYIFNGQNTGETPYTSGNEGNDNPDTKDILLAVSDGVNLKVNISGADVFGAGGTADNVFIVVKQLGVLLRNDDANGVSNLIGKIDSRLTQIYQSWADVGARANRLDLIENRLKDAGTNLTKLRSQVEDADMAEVMTNLKMAESVQRASLAAGARVIQPSLVDFLR